MSDKLTISDAYSYQISTVARPQRLWSVLGSITLAAGQQRRKKAAIRREKRNKPRRPSGPRDRPSTRERRRAKWRPVRDGIRCVFHPFPS
jgi:hypothetical protein